MRFEVLGPIRVSSGAEIPLDRSSHRRLLAILLFESGRPLDTDQLIDRHWGEEPPATAKAALQTHISQLRKQFGDGLIATSGAGYQVDLRGHHLDRQLFEALTSAAHTALDGSSWDEVVRNADRALDLWRGTPWEELRDDEFARSEIVRLEEERLELVELRAEALLALGRTEEALPDLERFVLEHPLRERLWEHLMLARARLGRITEAVQAYQDLRDLLAEMGLEPSPALRELEERILREDPVLVPGRIRHNLPTSLTTFIGRDPERTELATLLEDHRLVTLTGVGGSGKTRLAIELARERLQAYPDGVWMVDLAPLSDPSFVPSAVAVAIGLRAEVGTVHDAIVDALRHRQTLVVLDNCEHIVEGAAAIAGELLAAGPGVNVLSTSREQLGLPGELIYPVAPLDVPHDDPTELEHANRYGSVQLFVDRARLSANQFVLTSDNTGAVASICRRLDGLPLAIELAAARMASLSPAHVAARLEEGFGLVTGNARGLPPRQRAVEATIEWSYRLLTGVEQMLFARLSVFAGEFTPAAAEDVCAGGGIHRADVVPLLSRLIDKSLVAPTESIDGPSRHRLLETLREYARGRLAETEDEAEIRWSHRAYFHRLARALIEGRRADAVTRHTSLPDNLEIALDWSLSHGHATEAANLATALGIYWLDLGHARRAIRHLSSTLEATALGDAPELEALLRVYLASARYGTGDEDGALAEAARARELVADAGQSSTKAHALRAYARFQMLLVDQDPRLGIEAAREAVDIARATDDRHAEVSALAVLGQAEAWSGAADDGIAHLREALVVAEGIDDPSSIPEIFSRLLTAAYLDGERRRHQPRQLVDEFLSRWGLPESGGDEFAKWEWAGYVFIQSGEWHRADDVLERASRGHLEGYAQMWVHHTRGSLRWMQGRLDDASTELAEFRRTKPIRRWFHDLLPLEAEVAADAGRLEDVRATAAEYLAAEVHSSEESMKTGVLRPLVAAEVDAAVASSGATRDDHVRRATAAVAQIRDIIRLHPPLSSGSIQFETADTHLRLAEAELSRVTGPDPDLWRAVIDRASYVYWRTYARWRLAEALLAVGSRPEAIRELANAHEKARDLGAQRIVDELQALASRAGMPPFSEA